MSNSPTLLEQIVAMQEEERLNSERTGTYDSRFDTVLAKLREVVEALRDIMNDTTGVGYLRDAERKQAHVEVGY